MNQAIESRSAAWMDKNREEAMPLASFDDQNLLASLGVVAMRVEDRIEQAKQQLESMIDLNPSVLLLVDQGGKIVRSNRALLRMVGCDDIKSFLGRPLKEIFPSDDPTFFDDFHGASSGYQVRETRLRLPGHTPRDYRFTIVGSGPTGELCAVIVNDVTDEKKREAQSEQNHRQEAVRALAGALMHNLNQSLTVIAVRSRLMLMALEKGDVHREEWKNALQDISDLVMEMSEVLKRAEKTENFVTEPYPGGLKILDINRTAAEAPAPRQPVHSPSAENVPAS
jgi:hypothetical protein